MQHRSVILIYYIKYAALQCSTSLSPPKSFIVRCLLWKLWMSMYIHWCQDCIEELYRREKAGANAALQFGHFPHHRISRRCCLSPAENGLYYRGVTVMYYVLGMRQGWLGLPADIKCNGLSLHYVSIDPPKVQSVFMTSIHHWISFICITAKIDDMHCACIKLLLHG